MPLKSKLSPLLNPHLEISQATKDWANEILDLDTDDTTWSTAQLSALRTAINILYNKATPTIKTTLTYLDNEVTYALQTKGQLHIASIEIDLSVQEYTPIDPDLSVERIAQAISIPLEILEQLNGSIINFVPSRRPDSPTIFLLLDEHTSVWVCKSNLYDIDLLQSLNPVNLLEELDYGEKRKGDPKNFIEESKKVLRTLQYARFLAGKNLQFLNKLYESGLSQYQKIEEEQKSISELELQISIIQQEIILASQTEKNPQQNRQQREQSLTALLNQQQEAALQVYGYGSYNSIVYNGRLSFTGVEHQGMKNIDELAQEDESADDFYSFPLLWNPLNSQVRSFTVVDNALDWMEEEQASTATLVMGLAHTNSILARAYGRGDVNVVVVKPNEGPVQLAE